MKKASVCGAGGFIGFKDGYLYRYLEDAGSDFSKEVHGFNTIPEMKKWNEQYEKNLVTAWKEKDEVFLMN